MCCEQAGLSPMSAGLEAGISRSTSSQVAGLAHDSTLQRGAKRWMLCPEMRSIWINTIRSLIRISAMVA
jgi:hypothetical protein